MRRAHLAALVIAAVSAAAGTAVGAPPVAGTHADCSTVPVATADPALATPLPAFEIPPGGSCRVVDGGTIELVYPDGRLWAQWVVAPIPQGVTFFFADGRGMTAIPTTTPRRGPRAVLTRPGRRIALPEVARGADPCAMVRIRVAGRPRMRVDLIGYPPGRVWLQVGTQGEWRRIRPGAPAVWRVSPAIAAGSGRIHTVRLRAGGRTRLFPVCLLGPRTR